jgi:pyruvate/2-oxoglutarate dehydrogenase complex dihydrolipoamide dehydrogenase (E3) component
MLIIGVGFVGVKLAQIFKILGNEVRVIEIMLHAPK